MPHRPEQLMDKSWGARARRLRLDPIGAVAGKLRIDALFHPLATRVARRQLRKRGWDQLLAGVSSEAIPADPVDLMTIYRAVRKAKPQEVLELGSGQSTVFIALALSHNGSGHLWSVESEATWLEHSRKLIPPQLAGFVTFVPAGVEITHPYGVPAWRYTDVPKRSWGFVLIDGPELGRGADVSSDLVDLFDDLTARATGVVDFRRLTMLLAKELLGSRIAIRYRPQTQSYVFRKKS